MAIPNHSCPTTCAYYQSCLLGLVTGCPTGQRVVVVKNNKVEIAERVLCNYNECKHWRTEGKPCPNTKCPSNDPYKRSYSWS